MPPNEKDEHEEELNVDDDKDGEEDESEEGEEEDRGDKVDGKDDGAEEEEGDDDKDGDAEGADKDKDADEEEPATRSKRDQKFIPKPRFDEVNEGLKTERAARLKLEEENARLRGAQPPAKKEEPKPKFDFDAKEEEYADAMIEGDKKKAGSIRKEINAALQAEAAESAYERAVSTSRADRAKELLEDAASEMVEDYPFLDEKAKEANTSAIRQVLALRNDFIRVDGMRPDLALRKAAKEIGELYASKPKPRKAAADEAADENEEEEENDERPTRSKRDELAVARGARASRRQPAPLGGAGARARDGSVDVEKMSDSEFKGLSEKEKRKLRGDFV